MMADICHHEKFKMAKNLRTLHTILQVATFQRFEIQNGGNQLYTLRRFIIVYPTSQFRSVYVQIPVQYAIITCPNM